MNVCVELGTKFHSFLRNNLPHYIVPYTNSGFNFSFCNYINNKYICCVRYRTNIKVLFGKELIPGTYKNGKNFIWGKWNDPRFVDATCIFISEWINNNLIVDETIKPTFIWSQPICKPKKCMLKSIPLLADFRLFKYKGKLYTIDGNVSTIKEIIIKTNSISLNSGFYINCLCGENTEYCYDKNWSYVTNDYNNNFLFLNWIKDGYVLETLVEKSKCITNRTIKLGGNHIIDGNGSIISPMFSFGTPCIKISDDLYLGCGHIKIILNLKYDINSNIYKFRKQLFESFSKNINYIQHNSYIYCMYFFIYDINKKSLCISNSYLPMITSTKYLFSIFFPMSLTKLDSEIIVTGGYGDYYSVAINFDYNDILNKIIHDVSDFNINNFNYELIYC